MESEENNVDIGLDNKEVSNTDDVSNVDTNVESSTTSTSSEKYDNFAKDKNNEEVSNSVENEMSPDIPKDNSEKLKNTSIPGITVDPNNKKPFIFAVLFFVLIFLAAIGVYLLKNKGTIKDPNGNVVVNDQDMNLVLSDAVSKMENELQSCDFEGNVKLSFVSREDSLYSNEEQNMEYGFNNRGTLVEGEDGALDFYYKFDFDLSTKSGASGDLVNMNLDFETIFESNRGDDGNRYYIKLNDLSGSSSEGENLEDSEELKAFLEVFKGSWLYISDTEIEQMFGDSGFILYNIQKNKKDESDYKFNYGNYDLFSVKGNNAEIVKINGVDTYRVELKANPDELIKLFYDISKETNKEEERTLEEFLEEEAEDIKKAKDAIDFFMNKFDVEVYIGKEDNYIYRISASGSIDQETLKDFAQIIEEDDDNMTVSPDETMFNIDFEIDYTFSNFNSAFIETIPEEDTKSLKTIMEGFLPGMSISTPDTDGDGLSDSLEEFYGCDPNIVDTDGDGYNDFQEVDNGYDPTVAGSAKLDYDKLKSPSFFPFMTVL